MKLTGNISIESIIHIVRIDLLTTHVPSGKVQNGLKVDRTDEKRTVPVHVQLVLRPQGAIEQILIFQTRTQDSELWP